MPLFRRGLPLLSLALALAAPLIAGCQPADQPAYDPGEVRAVLSDRSPGGGPQAAASGRRASWSIALATFTVGDHRASAEATREILAQEHGLTGTYIASHADRSILYYGEYRSPDDPRLAGDLKKVKSLVIDDRQPFISAFLVPPDTLESGSDSPWSLASVRRQYGPEVRLYTLEVGVYEDPDREVALRAAEEAVEVYRRQNEPAYFYHGPHRSSVTIGVLTEAQVDLEAPGFGPSVRELRLRHPHRAVNGLEVRVIEAGRDRGIAPSKLMLIP